ncbi:class IV adenylate cyclase [Patescibacteria group bacterium]|nr:class IV adenylate cyclase [Patescibacteria group bacterium]
MSNQEIEIKVKVNDTKDLEEFLIEKGKFQFENKQVDQYYVPSHRDFTKVTPIKEWLRLRTEAEKNTINYKNWHYQEDGKAYHCDEYEIVIDDKDTGQKILEALDLKKVITVDKVRKVYIYQDYEVAIDSVKDLGSFIEVEYIGLKKISDVKHKSDEMIDFLKQHGCQNVERDFKGYPYLLLEKSK